VCGIGRPEPTDPPRGGLGFGDGDRVGSGEPFDTDRGARSHVLGVHHQLQAPPRNRTVAGAVEVQQRHAVKTGVGDQPLVARDIAVVENHHQLPQPLGRLGVAREPAPLGQVGCQRCLEQFQGRKQQAHRTDAIANGAMLGVGQPLDPAPVLAVGVGRHHRDLHMVGSVKRA
jgi:hypothetical protein